MEEDLKKLKEYLVKRIISLGNYNVKYPVQFDQFMSLSIDGLIELHEKLDNEYKDKLRTSMQSDIDRLRDKLPLGEIMQMEVDKINECGNSLK